MNTLIFFYVLGVVIWLYMAGQYDADTKIETAAEGLALVVICLIWPVFIVYLLGYRVQDNRNKKVSK